MSFPEFKQNLQFLRLQRYTLLRCGIDLNVIKGKVLLKNYWKFALLFSITLYLEYGLMNFIVHSSIDMVTGSLSIFNQCVLILLKMFVFLYKGDHFVGLIRDMNNLAEKANPKEYRKWLSENRRSQLMAKMYNYVCWTCFVCTSVIPIAFMLYDYYNENEVKYKLAFDVKFPHDNGSLLHFILNYILTTIFIYALVNLAVCLDTLFGWYIHNIAAHFRILRIKIANTGLNLEMDECRNFTKEIGCIVWYHNKILKFVEDMNAIFCYILWAEVMLSCLQLCFIIYTLNNEPNISQLPFCIVTFMALIVQLIIYCFGGDKVKTENDMLCMDFYLQFPWHKMSSKERKLMLLPLMRSQRPSTLRGLFFEVDRSLLVYIVNTAFSYNALLSAMKE